MIRVGDVYTVDQADRLGLIKVGRRVRTDGSTNVTGPQFTGTIVGINECDFYVSWFDKHGGSYDKWVIYYNNPRARIEFLADDEDITTNEKEESKSMSESNNTRSVEVNDTIGEVLGDKDYKTVMLVNKYFGKEIPNNYTGELLLEEKGDKFTDKALKLEEEAIKKAAAKG